MGAFQIRRGRDIKIKGAALKNIAEAPMPSRIAVQPVNFKGIKPHLLVHPGDSVKVGTPLFSDRSHPDVKVVSPASGKVTDIVRGEKRILLQIVIQADGRQEPLIFTQYPLQDIPKLSKEKVVQQLLAGGAWPFIRQRPFSKVAHPNDSPKAIFVQGLNTEPLAADIDFVLNGKEALFQTGLDVLKKLTKGDVHLCVHPKSSSKAFTQAKGVQIHHFSGPHPAGNISTYVHHIDPLRKGEIIWYVNAQDVVRMGMLFIHGVFSPKRVVALTGEGVQNPSYVKTVIGASIGNIVKDYPGLGELRYISGSVLTGFDAGKDGYLGFYDSQITVIPKGGERRLLGWLSPGFQAYSFSKTFASSFLPEKEASLDTDIHGGERAIVMNNVYDTLVPLDIMTFFLIRAIVGGDIEEAEKLGILECDEEDFALCSFACPSKVDVGAIIRSGLELIEQEG